MSKSSELDKKVKRYIIECVANHYAGEEGAFEIQDLDNINNREVINVIQYIDSRFIQEYGYRIKQAGRMIAMTDWLQGLALPIAFYNHDILNLAKEWGSLPENASEKQEAKILENYWHFMANKTLQLLDFSRVPTMPQKEIIIESYDYKHDVYGNPSARYSVNSKSIGKRRIQTGYDNHYHEGGAYSALEKAGFNPREYQLVDIQGSRSDGRVTSTWTFKQ